jgi:hypothetical protein
MPDVFGFAVLKYFFQAMVGSLLTIQYLSAYILFCKIPDVKELFLFMLDKIWFKTPVCWFSAVFKELLSKLTGIERLSGSGTTASVPCRVAANPEVSPVKIPPSAALGIASVGLTLVIAVDVVSFPL